MAAMPLEKTAASSVRSSAASRSDRRVFSTITSSEGALVAGDGAGHAEAGVAVDISGTEEALGEFIRGVIVLRQQLAGDVEGDAVGPVGCDGFGEFFRDQFDRRVPERAFAADFGAASA